MSQISVRFFTSLREIVNKREEKAEFADTEKVTVKTVLDKLVEKHGRKFQEYVYDQDTGGVRGFLQFLVNGRNAASLNGLDTVLEDGDVLAIIPPVGGG